MRGSYILACVLAGPIFAGSNEVTVHPKWGGMYAPVPAFASDPDLAKQSLLRLLLSPETISEMKGIRTVLGIEIVDDEKGILATAIDSAGKRWGPHRVVGKVLKDAGGYYFSKETVWCTGDEWGSSNGHTIVGLRKSSDNGLEVDIVTKSSGRVLIFSGAKRTTRERLEFRQTSFPIKAEANTGEPNTSGFEGVLPQSLSD